LSDRINLLFTAAGCPGGPSIIKSLRQDSSIRIVGTDMKGDVPAKYLTDGFYQVPPGTSENYIDEVLRVVEKERIDVILPLADPELGPLAQNMKSFAASGCKVCISDYAAISIAGNCSKLYSLFSGEDFVPEFRIPADWEDLESKIKELGFPRNRVVIKPFSSHGSIGLRVIDNESNLFDLYMNVKPDSTLTNKSILMETLKDRVIENLILTQYLPGKEYGVDLLIDPRTNEVISGIVRDNGEVELSGISRGELVTDQRLFATAKYVAEKLKLSYAVNIDFKLDENSKSKMLEINPRLPATCYLATAAGLNLPLLSVYLALGREFETPKIKPGLRIYSYRGFIVVGDDNEISCVV